MNVKEHLRPYQLEAWEKLDEALIERQERSTILALPCGAGKTRVAVSWLYERFLKNGCSMLWLVHRKELLGQVRREMYRVCPDVRVTEWTADVKDASGQAVLAMILSSRELTRSFDVIIIDEAHHVPASSYLRKIDQLNHDFLLGLTGTPGRRLDGKALPFDSIAIQKSVLDVVEEGYLAKPIYVRVTTGQRYRMRVHGRDFSAKSLQQLDNLARNQLVARAWAEDWERWGKTLVFCSSIQHAENLEAAFLTAIEEKQLPLSARTVVCVHSKLSDITRDQRVDRFARGSAQVLINIQIFTEGLDVPDIRSAFMARPTASETLYLQMIGRASRVVEGKKDAFYVVDFVDQLGKYSLLAARWAAEHLGAPQALEEIEAQARVEEARQAMDRAGLPHEQIRDVLKEFVLFAGLLEFKTQYDRQPVVMAVTDDLYAAIRKLDIMLAESRDVKNIVDSSYARTGASSTDIDLRTWRNLAWAKFFHSIGRADRGTFRFVPFKKTEVEEKVLREEMLEAAQQNVAANHYYAENRALLLQEVNEVVLDAAGIPDFARDAAYRDQIVVVTTDIPRLRLSGAVRKDIRQAITSNVSAALDIDVALLLHWS